MSWVFLGLLLVGALNGLPISPESDQTTVKDVADDEPVALALELLPPKIDAEDGNFDNMNFDNIYERTALSTDLLPPKEDENTTLSTDLLPPGEDGEHPHNHGVVFVINLFALRNETTDNSSDFLNDDIKEKIPGILEPYATVLLVVEDDNETIPVSLEELARDLEEEGVTVEKYGDDIDNKVIRIDFDGDATGDDPDVEFLQSYKMSKIRRRRSPHLLKKLKRMRMKNGGNSCDVCQQAPPPCMTCGPPPPPPCMTCGPPPPPPCSGGCAPRPPPSCMPACGAPSQQQTFEIIPIQIRWEERPAQNMGSCNTCGGQGYHGSYSQASAQASSHTW